MVEPVKGYYRFPTIHNNLIIFTAEGDLWQVTTDGGVAQRLTTHHGVESHAAISPDGRLIAFSAQYEGPTEIYFMPIQGGRPTRLTYEDETALVVGWTPDQKIIYSTKRYSTLPNTQLGLIDPQNGDQTLLPLAEASEGCFDDKGRTLFFTRLPFQGSHTKRYKGGSVQNIWKLVSKKEAIPLTSDYLGTSKTPMVWNRRIYFASDRDGTMNIWSMTFNGKRLKQHTCHKGWDIQTPKLHNGRIVYQLGADLHIYDIEANVTSLIDITLASDFDQTRQRWVRNPIEYVSSWFPSPNGERVAFTARGKLFVAPVENGRFVEATLESGIRYRLAQFSPDGESLFAYSDQTGEMEIWQLPANGIGQPEQITSGGDVYRYNFSLSPDGKWAAFPDKNNKLWLVNIEAKESHVIAESKVTRFFDLSWAPDSHWLAFVESAPNMHPQIKIFSLLDGGITAVTSDRVDSYSPAWSVDGKWLYFLSDRHFESVVGSPWGARQPEPYFETTTKIYMLSLQSGNRSPFMPLNELDFEQKMAEIEKSNSESDPSASNKNNSSKEEMTIKIEFEGIERRLYELPVPPGKYHSLKLNDKALFWIDSYLNDKPKQDLIALRIDNKDVKSVLILRDVQGFDLTADGKKILTRQKRAFFVFDASGKPPKTEEKKRIDLSRWTFSVNLRKEWRQMFIEAWRLQRDYFYDRSLHGIDWQGLLETHLPLLDRVTDRYEFNHLLSQLVGELSALHTFVRLGDRRVGKDRIYSGALGVRWAKDSNRGGYRIEYIYHADPNFPDQAGPLCQPDSQIKVGDIIEAINGVSLLDVYHPSQLLQNQARKQVRLKIKTAVSKNKKSQPQTYETIVKPISTIQENNLRYSDWEYTRRLYVEEKSEHKIGYVHLRAMNGKNYAEWTRNFYPVFNRQGLIIDMRHNRGGNIDSWILGRLLRKAWFYWQPRLGQQSWNMHYAFRGHLTVLINNQTSSDGEAFAEGFKRLGLGKVIGTRSWGGEIWYIRNTYLADKGIATAAQIGVYVDDEWLIEGHGVEPDIEVDNQPYATFHGEDAQLDYAISHLLKLIAKDPRPIPAPPPYPNKSFS